MKMATAKIESARPGRPRCFCEETALDAAMRVFWEKGYEGASLTDLTEAMGINRPSLYAAFGDKESLFLKAMARYAEGPAGYLRAALAAPTARLVVEALVNGAVELLGNPGNPRGCLSVNGALAAGHEAERIKSALVEWRKRGEAEIRKRLKRAQSEGDLPTNLDAGDITRYIATILNGLGVQASNGASKAQMTRVAQMALQALPF